MKLCSDHILWNDRFQAVLIPVFKDCPRVQTSSAAAAPGWDSWTGCEVPCPANLMLVLFIELSCRRQFPAISLVLADLTWCGDLIPLLLSSLFLHCPWGARVFSLLHQVAPIEKLRLHLKLRHRQRPRDEVTHEPLGASSGQSGNVCWRNLRRQRAGKSATTGPEKPRGRRSSILVHVSPDLIGMRLVMRLM